MPESLHGVDGAPSSVAESCVAGILARAEYNYMKIVAWNRTPGAILVGRPLEGAGRRVALFAGEELLYWTDDGPVAQSFADFTAEFPRWEVVFVPEESKVPEILERARSPPALRSQTQFAWWCVRGRVQNISFSRFLALSGVASKVGSVVGGVAGAAVGASTVSVPYYFLGLIPWGSTTTSFAASVGSSVAGMGWVASWVGCGVGVALAAPAIYLWARPGETEAEAERAEDR